MKKYLILFLPLLLLFNSCIDIVEEITVNPDQSGNVSFYMDLGTVGGLAMNLGKTYLEGTLADQLKTLPEKTAGILKGVPGLSNIKSVTNKKGMYSVSFDFKNAKQLNQAIYMLFDVRKHFYEPNYVRISKKKIVKKNYAPVLRLYLKKHKSQIKDIGILKSVNYKAILNCPEEVKRFSNKKSTLSANKKTLIFKCTIEELLNSKVNIGNKIKY